MKKRLSLYTGLTIFIGLITFFAASVYMTRANNFNIATNAVIEITQIAAGLYNNDMDIAEFVQVAGDTRITVISPSGAVLADSRTRDLGAVATHLSRPEVQAAASGSPEAHIRYSDTLGVNLIYYALKVYTSDSNTGNDSYVFVRAAIPVADINEYFFRSLAVLILSLIVVSWLCSVFIRSMINRITKPFNSIDKKLRLLASGEYSSEPIAGSYEEIDQITKQIDEVSFILQDSFDSLRDEKNKLDYILNNIADGIFAVDDNKDITLINNVALEIFDVTADIENKNLNYLTGKKKLIRAVEDCVGTAKDAIFEIALHGKIYFVTIKRLPDTKLTMAVLTDVTENRENTKRREEFFANASHELKTPLTAIKGFNELTAINNKDENISKYINSITRETNRMLTLIGDMLKLSELESTQSINPAPVSLANIVSEIHSTISAGIAEKEIAFEVIGDGKVIAEQSHIYELVKNIIENAVRYNNQSGKVSVYISSNKLTVSDSGIGISPEEQTRIFERFYRVEKSRSQQGGGTGLGLAIAKHICALYNWELSLKSKPGIGTEVTIMFSL